jgi:two-component system cell cycle sensor histidine kinase/response regulator CckA
MSSIGGHSLQDQPSAPIVSIFQRGATVAAAVSILIGCVGLLERFGNLLSRGGFPMGMVVMKASTALAFILSGISLWLHRIEQPSMRVRRLAEGCALLVALIGLWILLQNVLQRYASIHLGWSLFSNDLLEVPYPSWMSSAITTSFVLVGLSLLLLDVEDKRGRRPAQFLVLPPALFSLAIFIGYLFFGLRLVYRGTPYPLSAVFLSLALLLLSLGILSVRPHRGLIRVITADVVGSEVARRLLPAAVVVPLLLFFLCYWGYRARLYDIWFGLALLTTLHIAVFTAFVWRTGAVLNHADRQRRQVEAERSALNETLRQRVTELETLLDVLPVAVGIAEDPQCQTIRVNPAFAKLLALPPGANASKSAPPGEAPTSFRVFRKGKELAPEELPMQIAAMQGVEVRDFEEEVVWNDGTTLRLLGYAAPLYDEQGAIRGSVGAFIDITARARLEEQLFQARKLESIGRLAGGIAHDFNNLLTAIMGYVELAGRKLEADHPCAEDLEQIRKATDRAADLTGQLLAFARRQVIEPKTINLNELIYNLRNILQRLIGEHIQLLIETAEKLHPVRVDPSQFEQILINLVINARDAIPVEGGKITIETSNIFLDEEYARQHEGVTSGEYVMLAVTDTGSGMEEAVRLQIFEPFFTTKERGRGTGLGLATCYGIVKQAGGHIWLYSEVGKGSTFKIYLPRAAGAEESMTAPAAFSTPLGGTETILVVEDEEVVRGLATTALRGLGYRVWEATNGSQALQIARGREAEIALLITDVVMPKMSGKELAERLQAVNPALKVLFVSGYTQNTIVQHGVLEPGIVFLPKPFAPSTLSQKVREILDAG